MLAKYSELYGKIKETFPDLDWSQAIGQAFMEGFITIELAFELLVAYDEVLRG